jgi:hypothetical protein
MAHWRRKIQQDPMLTDDARIAVFWIVLMTLAMVLCWIFVA